MAIFASPARAQNLELHEPEIKAALLYNFLKYTVWPNNKASTSISVCVFGDDPFEGYLKPMAGRSVNQRTIALHQIHSTADIQDCNLLFINADERQRWPQLRDALTGKHILTVSDFDSFSAKGGIIEFGHQGNHINALLNKNALNNAGLRVEDRLLKLVTVVQPAPGDQP